MSSAAAGGGQAIAGAPMLPLGQHETNSLNGIDYWRVSAGAGDQILIDYGRTEPSTYPETEVCLLRPDATDFNLKTNACAAHKQTRQKDELSVTANVGGLWTLAVLPNDCESNGLLKTDCTTFVPYGVTAYVKHPIKIRLTAPALARRGARIHLRGSVSGISTRLAVQMGTRTIALVNAHAGRTFSVPARLTHKGRIVFRAFYPGDASHQAAVATASVVVV